MSFEFLSIDFERMLSHLMRLALAFLFALPIAWDREREERTLGLRTFPLVAMASTAYLLVARTMLGPQAPELARIVQGLITGIGFLGGGAIVKQGITVHGTATAASIWSTAAVGAAIAFDRYEIALALTAANFFTLRWMKSLKQVVAESDDD